MGEFTFDGRRIAIHPGDTYAAALHRAGVRVVSRSLKYHRPRGLYCVAGSCAGCLVDVDGEPNVAACTRSAADGATLRSQNRLGTAKHDLLGVVDKVYPGGFDPHDAFTRPRVVNEAFLKAVRWMSGLGRAPDPDAGAPSRSPTARTVEVDHLVVGGGRHGLAAALEGGEGTLIVDEGPRPGGSALWNPAETDTRALAHKLRTSGVETWSNALCFGLYDDGAGVVTGGGPTPDLVRVVARRITVATGRHDGWPLFPNNDLPGVLSLRGMRRLLHGHAVAPGTTAVVHGNLTDADQTALEEAGCTVLAEGTVEEVRGDAHVERARVDGTWHACDTVLCDAPLWPRVELLQQAGCALRHRGGALSPVLDGHRTTVEGVEARFTEGAGREAGT